MTFVLKLDIYFISDNKIFRWFENQLSQPIKVQLHPRSDLGFQVGHDIYVVHIDSIKTGLLKFTSITQFLMFCSMMIC